MPVYLVSAYFTVCVLPRLLLPTPPWNMFCVKYTVQYGRLLHLSGKWWSFWMNDWVKICVEKTDLWRIIVVGDLVTATQPWRLARIITRISSNTSSSEIWESASHAFCTNSQRKSVSHTDTRNVTLSLAVDNMLACMGVFRGFPGSTPTQMNPFLL